MPPFDWMDTPSLHMTICDPTQVLWRHRRPVLISFGSLILLVPVMSFMVRDGGPAWRSGERREASAQISVISVGTDALAVAVALVSTR